MVDIAWQETVAYLAKVALSNICLTDSKSVFVGYVGTGVQAPIKLKILLYIVPLEH